MFFNFSPSSYLFLASYTGLLMLSFFINDFIVTWILMELTMFMVMFFIYSGNKNYYMTALNLFIIQSVASLMILLSWFLAFEFLFLMSLFFKLALFPFSFWFHSVSKKVSFFMFLLLSIFQKILPLMLLSKMTLSWDSMYFTQSICLINMLITGINVISFHNLMDLLIMSSISNNSWLILGTLSNFNSILLFLGIYSLSLSSILYCMNWNLKWISVNMLALAGLPPFPLFWGKLYVLYVISEFCSPIFLYMFMSATLLMTYTQMNYFINIGVYRKLMIN